MSDVPAPVAVPEEVILGEDGQPLSKNALKKYLKAKENETKKAAKAAEKAVRNYMNVYHICIHISFCFKAIYISI